MEQTAQSGVVAAGATAAPPRPPRPGRGVADPAGWQSPALGPARSTRLAVLSDRLFAPLDIASLVYFRVAFGLIMLWEVLRYFASDRIARYYIDPAFHFTYFGFDWVQPWPGDGMYLHFYVLGAAALCVTLGLWYRISAAIVFLSFTHVFLLDQAQYLNHFYLVGLISFLLIVVPAHRAWSLDALRRPALRSTTAPAWALWLLRAQIGIVYLYGGLAKLNGDWLLGEPMRAWLARRTDFPLIGSRFTEEWIVYVFSYGGLLFDLFVVPLLIWSRTRPFALLVAIVFHLTNARLFSIGIFPWFMIAATLLFLPPSWPRALAKAVGHRQRIRGGAAAADGSPPPGASLVAPPSPTAPPSPRARRVLVGLLAGYLALQLLVPLRHHLYPGDVAWTEEGHRFSWRMKLRSKDATARFFATDPASQATWEVDAARYVNRSQYDEMAPRPDMVHQLAHHIAADLRRQGWHDVQVRALVVASLNGHEPRLLIDPTVDLAAQPRTLLPASWILPRDSPAGTPWATWEGNGEVRE